MIISSIIRFLVGHLLDKEVYDFINKKMNVHCQAPVPMENDRTAVRGKGGTKQ